MVMAGTVVLEGREKIIQLTTDLEDAMSSYGHQFELEKKAGEEKGKILRIIVFKENWMKWQYKMEKWSFSRLLKAS